MSKYKEKKMAFQIVASFVMMFMIMISSNLSVQAGNGTLNLTGDASYTSAQLASYNTIKLNGHKLTVTDDFETSATITLGTNGELLVKGNMTASGKVDMSGGVLTVNGSYTQDAKQFYMGYSLPATITIKKNFTVAKTASIYAGNSQPKMTIGGNFTYSTTANTNYNSATISVAGNVTQKKDSGLFIVRNLILNGKKTQTVTLNENSSLGSFKAENASIKLVGYLNDAKLESDFAPEMDSALKSKGFNMQGHKFTVPVDLITTGDVTIGTKGKLVVKGNLTASDVVAAAGGELTVNGTYRQTADALAVGGNSPSKITVKKDLIIEENGYLTGSSISSKVTVGGNFTYKSAKATTSNQVEWTVAGNVTQAKDSGKVIFGHLVLNGTKKQTLTFQENSIVHSINAKNSKIKLVGPLTGTTLKSDFAPEIDSTLKVYDSLHLNGHTFEVPVSLEAVGTITTGTNGKLLVAGDMIANAKVDVANGVLDVKGNYTQKAGSLSMSAGAPRVNVDKDLTFTETGLIYCITSNSKINVGGSLNYKTAGVTKYNSGEWTIGKNVIQTDNAGEYKAGVIILPNAGSKVSIPNGKISKLVLYNPLDKYTIEPEDGYNTLVTQITIKFDLNGGSGKIASVKVFSGDKFESLPTPSRDEYTFDGWYTKASGGTKVSNGTQINMTKNTTLYAHWIQNLRKGKAVDVFNDITSGDWFVDAVQYVYEREIMNGTGANTFTPGGVLTRGQFVTVLYNMENKPDITFKNDFDDVKEGDYFAKPVIWAASKKIASGVDTRTFGPNQIITREQLATMLYKYADAKGYKTKIDTKALNNYSDKGKVSAWAQTALQWAVTNKVMSGKATNAGNVLDPQGKASRAECAQMIKNFAENVSKAK